MRMSATQTFHPFDKLCEAFTDIQKGSFFNGYDFHTFNFKWFIKRVDSILMGKWKKKQEPFFRRLGMSELDCYWQKRTTNNRDL